MAPMQVDLSLAVTVLINLGGLAAIYTGLRVQIAVLMIKVSHIETELNKLQKH